MISNGFCEVDCHFHRVLRRDGLGERVGLAHARPFEDTLPWGLEVMRKVHYTRYDQVLLLNAATLTRD